MAGTNLFLDDEVVEVVARDLLYLAQHRETLLDVVLISAESVIGSSYSDIVKHVSDKIRGKDVNVDKILHTFQNLTRLQARFNSTPAQLIADLIEQSDRFLESSERDELNKSHESLVQALKNLGADHPLEVSRKAGQLFFAHQNIFGSARVITDLRPVFDQAGEKILEALVSTTLLINYSQGGVPSRIEMALDAEDLEALRTACERAQRKSVSLREELKEKTWPTKIAPDSE